MKNNCLELAKLFDYFCERHILMEINLVYRNEFIELVTPIIENEKVKRMDKYIQHGTTSTLDHCIAVAYVSSIAPLLLSITTTGM